MSSPIQPPPNLRNSSGTSPYVHHLPPPNLPPSGSNLTSSGPPPPPPPPRVNELPSLLSSPSASPLFNNTSQAPTLPPASSLSNDRNDILPPPPQQQHSTPVQTSAPLPPTSNSQPPFERNRTATPHLPSASPPSQHAGYRPLNVRDALTYLDQVKVRFSDQPDVYNRFLDIMKDFKSQAIDTPGVIERVSGLFKGHPNLISGFNTFLPPGYRIECSTDPREPDLIRVTTPTGTTTTTGGSKIIDNATEIKSTGNYYAYPPPPPPHHHHHQHHLHQPPPPPLPPQQQQMMPPSSSSSSSMVPPHQQHPQIPHPPPQQQQQPPPPPQQQQSHHHPYQRPSPPQAEKRSPVEFNHAINYNRFANDSEVYKQFLEILQTYQKDQKPIEEVYAHVQYLFNDAPDLLDEFKQFLPEISKHTTTNLPNKRKKLNVCTNNNNNNQTKRNKMKDLDEVITVFDPIKPSVSNEEVELFDRIRKHIGNKPSYEEFLKVLNLYTQQIVDADLLVYQVKIFIGNNKELFDLFKSTIGYEPKEHPIEKPLHAFTKPDLAHCKTIDGSPSYRIVPRSWQTQPCSGRDQLAWEVLNDEYVSHPIWASEDDGFVASKKSQYEEAMHRCEEERYDYNMNIDANLNVIALLEPIALRIEGMTAEEKLNFRLRPGLGGESVTIYERIIKKVYDKERGMEIIELLYSNPAQVVPILLKRLKQKDEEWKRAQVNFYRALDYQGITFKSNDRKAMAPKALVLEIEQLHDKKRKATQQSKHHHITYPFQLGFSDADLFKDVTRVIYSYIDRQAGYTSSDREKIRTFIQTFIPLCFHVEDVVPENMMHYMEEVEDEELAEDGDDNHSTATEDSESDMGRNSPRKRSQSPRRRSTRTARSRQEDEHTMDLLRDVLTKNQNALPRFQAPSVEVKTEDLQQQQQQQQQQTDENGNKLFAAAAVATAPNLKKRVVYSLFCNTTFYCFFRLYQMLYERLYKLKQLEEKMKEHPNMGKRINKVARDLGLYSSRFDDLEIENGYYQTVLDLIDRFFDGDIDQQLFEEHTRYIFVTDGYLLFTVDKLAHAVVKQIQAITVDPKSVELIRLFRSDQELESMSPRILSIYRLRAEDIVGSDENLYKISFDNEQQQMSVQLIGKDDYMLEPTASDKYEDYIASYMDWVNTTDGIDITKMKTNYLQR
ncbi:hypothetical protein K501DRAFT_179122 [Backusella circina FSU 941]|nr:hypothetical protein K501DRAFT_179122 [Backusella circina FSU 941]